MLIEQLINADNQTAKGAKGHKDLDAIYIQVGRMLEVSKMTNITLTGVPFDHESNPINKWIN